MRCGWNLDISRDKRAESRTSQSSKSSVDRPSCGSTISMPSTCDPASMQCLPRYPPIKPAAPVIITFILADLYARTEYRLARHSLRSPGHADTAREYRCRYTCPNDG